MTTLNKHPGHMVGTTDADLCGLARTHELSRLVTHPMPERQAKPVFLPPMKGASVREIKIRVARSVVIFLVDDSGSMYGTWADQTGIRYAAALSVTNLMDRSGGGRAAVIHWGTDAPLRMVLHPVDVRRGKKALKAAMVVPPTLGGNDLPLALRRAAEVTPPLSKNETVLYYVLTDGGESVTQAMHDAIAALPPGSIHVLLMDRCGICDPAMEAAWATCAFGTWTRLKTFDTEEMATQIAEIFATSIGLEMPGQTTDQETK